MRARLERDTGRRARRAARPPRENQRDRWTLIGPRGAGAGRRATEGDSSDLWQRGVLLLRPPAAACAPRDRSGAAWWTCGREMDAVRACAYETHGCQDPACLSRQHPHTFGVRGNASLTRAQSPRPRGRSPRVVHVHQRDCALRAQTPLASCVLVVALDVLRRGPRSRRGSAERREEGANCGRTALAVAGPGTASCLFGQMGVTESEKR